MSARLAELYNEKVVPSVKKAHNLKSNMAVSRIEKVVISVGMGDFFADTAKCNSCLQAVTYIAGQKACFKKAKQSVAAFKIREGMNVGAMVTLRKARMYEFLDRLRNMALPRMRDFKGFKVNSFNGRAFSFGLKDISIFPEVKDLMKTLDSFGLNITIVSNIDNKEIFKSVLLGLGFPFEGDDNVDKE
jgi:large subunit ribosomal protein L5